MPADIDQLLRQALEHHGAGRRDLAAALYRRMLALQPDEPRAVHLLGLIASEEGRYDEAIDAMTRSIALYPNLPAFHNNLGEAYRHSKRPAEAERSYRAA